MSCMDKRHKDEPLSVTRFRGHRLNRIVVGGRVFGEDCARESG